MQNLSITARLMIAFLIAASLIVMLAVISGLALKGVAAAVALATPADAGVLSANREIIRVLQASKALIVMGAVSGCLLCVSMGAMLARAITRPLRDIRMGLEELAEGKLPKRLAFPGKNLGGDDLVRAGHALNTLIDARENLEHGSGAASSGST